MTSNAAKSASVAESDLNDVYFERLRDHYEGQTELPYTSRYYRQLLARYLNYLIPANASVFEVGVGSGYLLKQLNGARKGG